MLGWLVILGLFLVIFIFLKLEHNGKTIKVILITLIGILIFMSINNFLAAKTADFNTPKGVINGVSMYVSWLWGSVTKLWSSKSDISGIVGNAVKEDWNQTKSK